MPPRRFAQRDDDVVDSQADRSILERQSASQQLLGFDGVLQLVRLLYISDDLHVPVCESDGSADKLGRFTGADNQDSRRRSARCVVIRRIDAVRNNAEDAEHGQPAKLLEVRGLGRQHAEHRIRQQESQYRRQNRSPPPLIHRTYARASIESRRRIDQQQTSEQRDPLRCRQGTVPVVHERDQTRADEGDQHQRQVANDLQHRPTAVVAIEEADHSRPARLKQN